MKNVILTTEQQVDTTDESLAQPAYTAEELMAAAQSLSTKR